MVWASMVGPLEPGGVPHVRKIMQRSAHAIAPCAPPLLVGAGPGRPAAVSAAEVGPGSEGLAVNQTDAWEVTADNSVVRIANPNGATVTYSLYLIGTSVAAAGGSGGSG